MENKSAAQKLKILCLHGYNNHEESFAYMTQGFRDRFGHMAEFHILDGPYLINEELSSPEPMLIQKGFKGPFRAWFKFASTFPEKRQYTLDQKLIDSLENFENVDDQRILNEEYWAFEGIEESAKAILQTIRDHGPFDGILGFS